VSYAILWTASFSLLPIGVSCGREQNQLFCARDSVFPSPCIAVFVAARVRINALVQPAACAFVLLVAVSEWAFARHDLLDDQKHWCYDLLHIAPELFDVNAQYLINNLLRYFCVLHRLNSFHVFGHNQSPQNTGRLL